MRIAVVIPTLNESLNIAATLASLAAGRPDLVVVADCESTDGTADLARDAGATVISETGLDSRGAALQAGVDQALAALPEVDVIWFLHGDTLAPSDWRDAIETALTDPSVVGGAFTQRFTRRPPPGEIRPGWFRSRLLRFVIFANRVRYRITGVYFGDQGIFVRPDALERIGGIPQSPLMEDVDLCLSLRRLGPLHLSPAKISTSPRRFLENGIFFQMFHDVALLLTHRLGLRPRLLYDRYNADNRRRSAAV